MINEKALEEAFGKKMADRILGKTQPSEQELADGKFYFEAMCNLMNKDIQELALEEALAHLRTLANFGGTLEQARELAQKGVERVEGMK